MAGQRPHLRAVVALALLVGAVALALLVCMVPLTNAVAGPIVEGQDFEDPSFPPRGWEALDKQAIALAVPPRYTFGRQSCMVEANVGGNAAAWALGGGTMGDELPCGRRYPANEPINSWLVYTLDTTGLAGVGVNMRFKVDQPTLENFRVCVTTGVPDDYFCQYADVLQADWSEFEWPLEFWAAGGQPEAKVIVAYTDLAPTGGHVGLVVDNIVITEMYQATPPPPSPTATGTATDAPTPTATLTPPPPEWDVFVPIAHRTR